MNFYQPSNVTTQIRVGEQHCAMIPGLGLYGRRVRLSDRPLTSTDDQFATMFDILLND